METTTNLREETISGLQKLIEINIDSGKGFEVAAEKIHNQEVAQYFRKCSSSRKHNADELQRYVTWNGKSPEDSGSVKGTLHRWWLGLRGEIQDGDEHAILAEAERGEDAIKGLYEKVIKDTTGSPLNAVLHQQYAAVKADHDSVRDMRDARA